VAHEGVALLCSDGCRSRPRGGTPARLPELRCEVYDLACAGGHLGGAQANPEGDWACHSLKRRTLRTEGDTSSAHLRHRGAWEYPRLRPEGRNPWRWVQELCISVHRRSAEETKSRGLAEDESKG